MKRTRSLFGPLVLIATGVVWLLVSMNVIPAGNLWALTHIWPFVLIILGVGLILRSYWPAVGQAVSALVVLGALLAVIYAPQLGWADAPRWGMNNSFSGSVAGSGQVHTETREVSGFQAVSVRYPAEVAIQQGEAESVKVEADDNLLPQLDTVVRNGTLYIENNEPNWGKRVNSSKTVKITITVKDLHQIDFSSAGKVRVESLKTDELKINVSGAGDVTLNKLDVRRLESSLSGAGNIKASGVADEVKLTISGLGNFDGPELSSMSADVRISGAGNITILVKNDLNASISGAGSVSYYGSPHVTQHISGAGTVRQAGK